MKATHIVATAALLFAAGSAFGAPVLIAEWDFNSLVDGVNPLTVAPSYQLFSDSGSQYWLNGTVPATAGARSTHYTSSLDKSSDPAAGASPNNYAAYNTQGYDVTGDEVAWKHSTLGYTNIFAEFDYRRSTTAPTDFTWVYSTDGGSTWVDWNDINLVADTVWHNNNSSTSPVFPAVCGNNPLCAVGLAVRSADGTTSTVRYDMLQIYGDVVPEPGSVVALAVGVVGVLGLRRRAR